MKDLEFLKGQVDDKVLDVFLKFARDDEILQAVINKSQDTSEFINSLMSAAICVISREQEITHRLTSILQKDPSVQDQLKSLMEKIK